MNSDLYAHLDPRARAWNTALLASPGELDLHVPASEVEGSVPEALRGGRVLSNGPGWTRIGGVNVHPFDGHGYLRSFELLADGSCRVRARFVDTRVYRDEAAAGRLVHRGFATNLPERRRNLGLSGGVPRNVANTTITRWDGRLLAGWEGGVPHALDPESLATRGEETFGGLIAGQTTLAHMHHDEALGRLVLCSSEGFRQPKLTFREIGPGGECLSSREQVFDGPLFIHDFAITPNWYVVGGNPLRIKLGEFAKTMVGASTLLRSIATDTRGPGVFYLIPRSGDGPMRTIRLPDHAFVVHFGGAFEQAGTVHADACIFNNFEFGAEFGYTGPNTPFDPTLSDARGAPRLLRVTIPPGASAGTWRQLAPHGVDFPRIHPDHDGQETALLVGACRSDPRFSDPFDALIRVDLRDPERPPEVWSAPDKVFVGEPLFAPNPTQADLGHVIALLSDGLDRSTTLAIFDASALGTGPIARVRTPLLPLAFHGEWDPSPGSGSVG